MLHTPSDLEDFLALDAANVSVDADGEVRLGSPEGICIDLKAAPGYQPRKIPIDY